MAGEAARVIVGRGKARPGRRGVSAHGGQRHGAFGAVRLARQVVVWLGAGGTVGQAWYGVAWSGMSVHGEVRFGRRCRGRAARPVSAGRGELGRGWQVFACPGVAA